MMDDCRMRLLYCSHKVMTSTLFDDLLNLNYKRMIDLIVVVVVVDWDDLHDLYHCRL